MDSYSIFVSSEDGFVSVQPIETVDDAGNTISVTSTHTLKRRKAAESAYETASA